MSTRVSMALTDEAESPQGTSFTATCTLEFDEDPSQPKDIATFQNKVHTAIAVCCRAIHDELRATTANT